VDGLDHQVERTYDLLGRVTSETIFNPDGNITSTWDYQSTADGLVVTYTDGLARSRM